MSRLSANRLRQLADGMRSLPARIGRPERLHIYLGCGALAVCRASGRFRRVVQDKAMLPSAAFGCDGMHGVTEDLATLTTWLHAHPHRGTIEWIIGIDHVRYVLLPWDARLSNESFCHTLASALFAQQFPASEVPFSAYQLRFASLSFGRPRLVALIPNDIIGELTAFAARHHCHTRRITPALSVVWNRFFSRVKNDTGVLALVEEPRLLRVTYDHGHVTALSLQPFSAHTSPAMPRGVTYRFPARDIGMPESEDLAPRGLSPDDDPRIAYALCGVS